MRSILSSPLGVSAGDMSGSSRTGLDRNRLAWLLRIVKAGVKSAIALTCYDDIATRNCKSAAIDSFIKQN